MPSGKTPVLNAGWLFKELEMNKAQNGYEYCIF